MTSDAYLFDISRATDAGTLQAYRMDAINDDMLTSFEKGEICAAIDARYGQLNAEHPDAKRKPRWS
jgi:hypothetical protein